MKFLLHLENKKSEYKSNKFKISATACKDLDVLMPMYNLLEYSKNYIDKPQVFHGIIIEMNQIVVQIIII